MTLNVDEYGAEKDTPVLVILHGLFGAADNWRTQAKALAGSRRVIVPDLPNHGRSPHTDSTSIPEMAVAVTKHLDSIGVTDAEWLGHSLGGKIAMVIALTRPDLVERLIVADIAPRRYPPRHKTVFSAMHAVSGAQPDSRNEAERVMVPHIPEKAVRLFLLKSYVRTDGGGYRWLLNVDTLERCYHDLSGWPTSDGSYEGAALFVRGDRSDYVQEEDYGLIQGYFPQATIETVSEAGHWLHAEQKERFLNVVQRFLP